MQITPVVLESARVRLEPLSLDHCQYLADVGLDPELWNVTLSSVRTPDEMREWVEHALRLQSEGTVLPFAIFCKPDSRFVGSTRFMTIDRANRKLEIGSTWIARAWQRSYVNSETKYLLLTHAFETLGCIRVEFKTDSLNEQSRNALLRIGATEEGILRNHMITQGGRYRHSVYFSIIEGDWPIIKKRLEGLARF